MSYMCSVRIAPGTRATRRLAAGRSQPRTRATRNIGAVDRARHFGVSAYCRSAGKRRLARRLVNVNTVVGKALSNRASACRAGGIEIVRQLDEHAPKILADPLLLQEAILNIVINAEQAVAAKGGGRIEARTKSWPARNLVVIEIRDTGPGIPPEVMARIFEPFYTTKEVGQGTGLGLAITYGIVQEHGGHVLAATHQEGGAVFTVELPTGRG